MASFVTAESNPQWYCILNTFAMLAVLNGLNCPRPLMVLTNDLVIVPSLSVENSISICHECGPTCTYKEHGNGKITYVHDWTNNMYSFNIWGRGSEKGPSAYYKKLL